MYLTDVTSDRLGSVTSHGPSLRLLVEVTAYLLLSSHGQVCSCCVASLSPSNKLMWCFTKMDNQKRKLPNIDDISAKKWKTVMLKVKFHDWTWVELQLTAEMSTLPLFETAYAARRIKWRQIPWPSSCDAEDKEVPEEVTLGKSFTWKGLSKVFCNIKSPKDKRLETDSDLQSVATYKGVEKMFALSCVLNLEKASLVSLLCMSFYKETKHSFSVSLFFSYSVLNQY